MKRYFVILAAMRTGSNLLERTLGELGDTVVYGEAFNPAFMGGPRKQELLGWSRTQRDRDPKGFLDSLIASGEGRMPGFRLFDGHNDRILERVLADPECARIILTRDLLETYVSLKIARTTDQWMLRKAKRRQTARIMFDPAEFELHRNRLDAHYAHIDATMATAGTDAVRIDYTDLTVPEELQRVARHIGSSGTVPDQPPILRQNPGALWEKVTNYADMCQALGRKPVLPPAARSQDILLPRHVPLALAPIAGPALAPAAALIQRIEVRAAGQPQRARNDLLHALSEGTLFPSGEDIAQRRLFAMTCHPALRLHGLFLQSVFGPGWRQDPVRQALAQRHAPLPDPKGLADLDPPTHYAGFAAFLDLVAETQTANGPLCWQAKWCSQAATLAAYRADGADPAVIDFADIDQFAADLCAQAGLPPFPNGQMKAIRTIGDVIPLALSDILDAPLAKKITEIHADDFETFGYAPYPS